MEPVAVAVEGRMLCRLRSMPRMGTAGIERTNRQAAAYWMPRLKRGMTVGGGGTVLPRRCNDGSLSACRVEDATPHAVFKPSRCSNTSRMTEEPAIAGPGARLTDCAMMKECR